MNQWIDTYMYYVLLLFAFAANISTGATSCAIALGVIFMVADAIQKKSLPKADKTLCKVIGTFLVLQCLVAANSWGPQHSFGEVYATAYRFLPLFFVMFYIKEKKQLVEMFTAFIFSVFINDAYTAYQFFALPAIRPIGFSSTATFLASHMLMAIPVMYLLWRKSIAANWAKKLAGVTFFFSIVVLYASETRGAWIAFALVVMIFLLLAKENRKVILKGAFVILFLVIGLCLFVPSFQSRIVSISNVQTDQSNLDRIYMWESACNIVRDHPVFGVGQDQFVYAYNDYYILPQATHAQPGKHGFGHPHNNILQVAAEQGSVGLIAFFLLHGYFLIRLYRQYRQEPGNSYGIIGLLILIGIHLEGMTDSNIGQVPIMREYWLLMGMFFVGGMFEQKDHNKSSK